MSKHKHGTKSEELIPMCKLMDSFNMHRASAMENRDRIPMDASEAEQRNWQFFNGKVCVIDAIESHLRLYLSVMPERTTSMPEKNNPGTYEIRLSNGSRIMLETGDDELHLSDGFMSEGTWIGTITKDGILCSPNSGSACADMVQGLKADR